MNIAVLFGGISPERNVSIDGGKAVINALESKGHKVFPVDPAFGKDALRSKDQIVSENKFVSAEEMDSFNTRNLIECADLDIFDEVDVAFIVLHGENGEDGKMQALLELRGVPYTGSGVKASSLAIDKNSSKMIFTAAGILTPEWVIVPKEDWDNYDYFERIRSEFGYKLVVKPNNQGSTVGITIIEDGNLDDIHNAVIEASKYCDIVLIEKYIDGQEITVGIIGEEPLPLIEIIPEGGFYDYKHKYTKGKTQYICPAEINEDIAEFMQGIAQTAYLALDCKGFARADFRLNEDGEPYLMEINTIPGFTATSLVPMAAKEIGMDFPELCEKIIELTLTKK
jgi:D-alanine-D-alanine ligase